MALLYCLVLRICQIEDKQETETPGTLDANEVQGRVVQCQDKK
jgi:hypothetical protein